MGGKWDWEWMEVIKAMGLGMAGGVQGNGIGNGWG